VLKTMPMFRRQVTRTRCTVAQYANNQNRKVSAGTKGGQDARSIVENRSATIQHLALSVSNETIAFDFRNPAVIAELND
jgi:hypothetical protein